MNRHIMYPVYQVIAVLCTFCASHELNASPNPEVVEKIASLTASRPSLADLDQINPEDAPAILDLYNKAATLPEKFGLTWALLRVDDKKAVDAILTTINKDYQGQVLDWDQEERVFIQSLQVLGILAGKNDKAYHFIKSATVPSFWENKRTWKSSVKWNTSRYLTRFAIQALGASGRPEVPHLLLDMKENDALFLYDFASSIGQAAFYHDMIQAHGENWLLRYILMPSDTPNQDWTDWKKTPQGSEWVKWADEKQSGPRPKAEQK